MYHEGKGVAQDNRQAYMWLSLAAATLPKKEDREKAVRNRERVAAKMTRAQIDEARKLVRGWKPKPKQ